MCCKATTKPVREWSGHNTGSMFHHPCLQAAVGKEGAIEVDSGAEGVVVGKTVAALHCHTIPGTELGIQRDVSNGTTPICT